MSRSRWTVLLAVLVVATGCTAPATPRAAQPGDPGAPAPSAEPRAQRRLVVAEGRPVENFGWMGLNTDPEVDDFVGAGLVSRNQPAFQVEPWMAEALPSLETGTWQVSPDGTMVTTWHLRPNIKWHDGTPFSTEDFVFGWEVSLNPRIELRDRPLAPLMTQLETPDDRTLIIHWKQSYPLADRLFRPFLPPMPRHLLEGLYRSGDYERFNGSPRWVNEFIGTGPYKVLSFEPAVVAELQAFDDYFLGKPKIDRITFRIISDPNVMLSNVLTNDIDVTLRDALNVETGLVARDQWEARGEGQVLFTPAQWRWVNLTPLNPWFTDVRVRRALLYAIDREAIVQTLSRGEEQVIHAPIHPRRQQYPRAEAAMTKYEYDPQRAAQLLEEVGWHRGTDGVLVNGQGERFVFDGRVESDRADMVQMQTATISYWNAVGAQVQVNNIPARLSNSEEFRNSWTGAYWGGYNVVLELWPNAYHSRAIPTEANQRRGLNTSRWNNPQVDAILDEMNSTLDARRRDDLVVEFVRLFTLELPHLPLNYSTEVTTVRKGLTGVFPRNESGAENTRTWNAHLWEWQ